MISNLIDFNNNNQETILKEEIKGSLKTHKNNIILIARNLGKILCIYNLDILKTID